jgi:hypothetical protein
VVLAIATSYTLCDDYMAMIRLSASRLKQSMVHNDDTVYGSPSLFYKPCTGVPGYV